ncbi:hypothetical protein [Actinoplanes solisilvae]|uniref:hypothetical protein n=1 Tax=Actinoplanes solisilvae TaxID=2486853 RepID=UPI000FDAC33E|nr:hypothetical protein [Actinoplanes solisilvae]
MSQAAHDEDPGFLVSAATTLRLILGWAFVALAGLDLAMGLDGVAYVMFHVVVLLTGLVLLGADRVGRRPSRFAWLAGASVAGAGLVVSAIPVLLVECCSSGYAVRHGFPFTMLARDPGGWRFDLYRTVVDLLFWLCAGLLVTVVVARVKPPRDKPAPRTSGHAEARNTPDVEGETSPVADPKNVGGLP